MDFNKVGKEAQEAINKCRDLSELEEISRRYLGRKGVVTSAFQKIAELSHQEKREQGRQLNQLRGKLEKEIEQKRQGLKDSFFQEKSERKIDISRPGKRFKAGHLHPLTQVVRRIEDIFQLMGFSVAEGPELETEYYNFDALNIPADHPARDIWDTFWVKGAKKGQKNLLRTHTSPNQVRYLEKNHPPLRIIVPGMCYRHEATDRTHGFQFMQVEGLMVDREVSLANFKAVVEKFCQMFFGPETEIRIIPDYFPFTEPSVEVSIRDKDGRWLEIMGAGLVHPNVFKSVGYRPYEWQGFAFGVGVERLAMIKYGLDDLRQFYQGDLRLIQQF
ncbi:MAG TPA: phenylalanine--tRNA ligase subunit alpha [Candidatus Pacearchaeota archaeon]|nr:phenylalanine--tRNA ligase subunit alpha [Candidatus Pacearchaeota archaeon]